MRRKEEERAKARRADRGLKPLRDSEPAGALSNGDGPHTEPSDASEEKEVAPSFWLCCTTMPVEGVLLDPFQHPSIRPQSMLVALHAQAEAMRDQYTVLHIHCRCFTAAL